MDGKERKKSFVFNVEWQEILLAYPAEVRLEVYDAVIEYVASGTISELKPMAKMAFSFIKKEVDYNNGKYEAIVEKRSEAGKRGGNPNFKKGKANPYYGDGAERQKNITKDNQTLSNITKDNQGLPKISLNDNVNDNVIEKDSLSRIQKEDREGRLRLDEIEDAINGSQAAAEGLMFNNGLSPDEYAMLKAEIFRQWEFEGYKNTLSDAKKHFANLIRLKAKDRRAQGSPGGETVAEYKRKAALAAMQQFAAARPPDEEREYNERILKELDDETG